MKSKIPQNLSYRFFLNFGSKRDSAQQINCENLIIGCMVGFRAILTDVYQTFLPYMYIYFGPRLEYMFEWNLKLSLHIPKRFDACQVLKWFLLLLEATCIIFAHATNTDVWQAIVARATKSRKNCSKPP